MRAYYRQEIEEDYDLLAIVYCNYTIKYNVASSEVKYV